MISKELLNEVLEEEVLSVRPYISDDPFYKNVIMWECRKNTMEYYDTINIYELAHKCKEWAFSLGCELSSFKANYSGYWFSTIKFVDVIARPISFKFVDVMARPISFNSNKEPEAIFKACQWILDNKED